MITAPHCSPRRLRLVIVGILMVLGLAAATVRADDEVDARAAAKAFAKAAEAGDAKAAKAMAIFTADEEAIVDGMVRMSSAGKNYIDAAVKQFGSDAAKLKAPGAGLAQRIDSIDITVDEDVASVGPEARPLLIMRKVNGTWKFDVTGLNDKMGLSRSAQFSGLMSRMFADLTADLNAGKFKTLAELQSARDAKLNQLKKDLDKAEEMPMEPGGAGGAPATKPATSQPTSCAPPPTPRLASAR